jgi:hypothetical protein
MQSLDTTFIDKGNVFIEVTSPSWRVPLKLSVKDLLNEIESKDLQISDHIDQNTLVIDKNTQKVKVNEDALKSPSVFGEEFTDQNISYNLPPQDASAVTGMHMMIDNNGQYLYVWTGNRWKRIPLSEW